MPRYFFHSQDGRVFHDEDGTDLPDHAAAKQAMLNILADTIRNSDEFWTTSDLQITAANAEGLVLFRLQLMGSDSAVVRGADSWKSPTD